MPFVWQIVETGLYFLLFHFRVFLITVFVSIAVFRSSSLFLMASLFFQFLCVLKQQTQINQNYLWNIQINSEQWNLSILEKSLLWNRKSALKRAKNVYAGSRVSTYIKCCHKCWWSNSTEKMLVRIISGPVKWEMGERRWSIKEKAIGRNFGFAFFFACPKKEHDRENKMMCRAVADRVKAYIMVIAVIFSLYGHVCVYFLILSFKTVAKISIHDHVQEGNKKHRISLWNKLTSCTQRCVCFF